MGDANNPGSLPLVKEWPRVIGPLNEMRQALMMQCSECLAVMNVVDNEDYPGWFSSSRTCIDGNVSFGRD
ncbi:hypothetical protein DFR49_1364 [Hephaestia caeni]|uniref:Uncharacterized protein n=1 Tax=Hephaestia caeni TaxID=645617 RepID=A0A397PL09_9SPHN|nr:hypothetical protein [Hephaestia caeni]RIA46804.1 hypothetical protein DFR49_1364 [Hephaestia caeni]